jgi:hypothetical protein
MYHAVQRESEGLTSQDPVAGTAKDFDQDIIKNNHPCLRFDEWAEQSFCEVFGFGAQSVEPVSHGALQSPPGQDAGRDEGSATYS